MSHGVISSSHHYCSKFILPTRNSKLQTCSTYLNFDFSHHYPILSFSVKTQSGSSRAKPIMASMTSSSLYVAAESFYELLGISERGTLTDIKQAYKQLVLKYHPDLSPPERIEEYTNKFIQIQKAYETLSDPNSRALYDSDLARGLHMAFSAKKQFHYNDKIQLMELKRRRTNRESRNMSMGARMRKTRD